MQIGKILNINNTKKLPNFLESKFSSGKEIHSKPWWVQIEPTTKCNLDCKMCPRKSETKINNDLSFLNFKKILNKLPKTIVLNLQGLGEPFLNDEIFKMIRYAKNKGVYVFTISNGNVLNENMNKKIIKSGLDHISFSMDGPTKKTYEKIRRNGNFDKFIENLTNLSEMKEEMDSDIKIKLLALLNRENFEILDKYVKIASRLNVDKFTLEKVNDEFDYQNEVALTKSQRERIDKKIENLQENTTKKKNINFSFAAKGDCYTNCRWPWEKMYINYDGSVTPCCNLPSFKVGNILEENLGEIWNNEAYKNFRQEMKKRKPTICRKYTS